MNKVLIGSIALAAFVVPAMAADLSLAPPPQPLPPRPWSWNGCYGGGNVGWNFQNTSDDLRPSGTYLAPAGVAAPPNAAGTGLNAAGVALVSHSYTTNGSGSDFGIQAGCNMQVRLVILGAEADWQWSGVTSTVNAFYPASAAANPAFTIAPHTESVSTRLNWFSTLRGRVGIDFDHLLIYGTGGLVLADVKSDTAVNFSTFPVLPVFNGALHAGSNSTTRGGAVVGAGVEWCVLPNWSVKAEYLYMWLNGFSYTSPLVAAAAPFAPGYSWTTNVNLHENIVRVGLNYRFDWSSWW